MEKRRSQEVLADDEESVGSKRTKVEEDVWSGEDDQTVKEKSTADGESKEEFKEDVAKEETPKETPKETTKETTQSNYDDSEIGSDLDSDLDDDDDDIEGALGNGINSSGAFSSTKNQIIGLFDKVQRTRNRWRCAFNSCIARIDGRDYLFHRLNGEFEW